MAKGKQTTKAKGKAKTSETGTVTNKQADIRKQLRDLNSEVEKNYLVIAELMHTVRNSELYAGWGFNTFEEYADKDLSIAKRKAYYLTDVWQMVKDFRLSKPKVQKIGWTKMRELKGIIDVENAKEILDLASKLSHRQLKEELFKKYSRKDTKNRSLPTLTTMTFKLQTDENSIIADGLEQAKALLETDNNVVALVHIVQSWLEDLGATPKNRTIDDEVSYIERTYGVKVTVEGGAKAKKAAQKKVEKESEQESDAAPAETETKKSTGKKKATGKKKTTGKKSTAKKSGGRKKTTSKKKTEPEFDPDDEGTGGETDSGGEPEFDDDNGGSGGDSEQDIDDLLGID